MMPVDVCVQSYTGPAGSQVMSALTPLLKRRSSLRSRRSKLELTLNKSNLSLSLLLVAVLTQSTSGALKRRVLLARLPPPVPTHWERTCAKPIVCTACCTATQRATGRQRWTLALTHPPWTSHCSRSGTSLSIRAYTRPLLRPSLAATTGWGEQN